MFYWLRTGRNRHNGRHGRQRDWSPLNVPINLQRRMSARVFRKDGCHSPWFGHMRRSRVEGVVRRVGTVAIRQGGKPTLYLRVDDI